ncbi:MAG: type III-A CRISPR-associated protein Cas10/Csm1, partial [Cytophagaceae bacterium]|nr:type III-A CRISPR-associated protein Cas10/Csm1 [Cytophagaceae bacterium]
MANDLRREAVYLAGLVHDIGKFYQRGDEQPKRVLNRSDVTTFCPVDQYGGYTHKHVLWTAQFLEDHPQLFAQNADVFGSPDAVGRFFRYAVAHHKPDAADIGQRLVQKADHYASGLDRTSSEGLKDEYEEINHERSGKWDDFRKVRMVSIFEPLLGNQLIQHRLPVASVTLDKSFFPKKQFAESATDQYVSLWQAFTQEVAQLPRQSFGSLADSLLYLLEKYTVTVPSSTQHLPDVSLYDHLKSTAALALCLHDYLEERNGLTKLDLTATDQPFLLIGGDLSGIQAYIYDIIGKNAAKNLKGRSFYLQLLVDSIVQRLVDGLGLYRANIVYSSGGGFYLLAPNTQKIHAELAKLRQEISEKLRDEQGLKLYMALDCEPVSQGQVFGKKINEVWTNLSKRLSARKRNRFADFMVKEAGYQHFFEPSEVGGESRGTRDAITGEEFVGGETRFQLDPGEEDSPEVTQTTFNQVRLGKALRQRVEYQVMTKKAVPYWEPTYELGQRSDLHFNPLNLGYCTYFLNEQTLAKLRNKLRGSVDDATILSVNKPEMTDLDLSGNRQTQGFTFYGGNDTPRATTPGDDDEKTAGSVLYFEELAGDVSLKRLGILRMDVDNLGYIFKEGFTDQKRTFSRDQKRTFSRYSALS